MAAIFSVFKTKKTPFLGTYRYLQRQAHEQPSIFYSIILGTIGPLGLVALSFGKDYYGVKPIEPTPTTYPVPRRARRPVHGYEDEA